MKSGLFGAEPCTAAPPHDCAALSRAQPRSVLSRHQPRCTALWRSLLRSASLSRAQSRSVALSRAQPRSDVLGMKSGLFGAEPCTAAPPQLRRGEDNDASEVAVL